VQAVKRVPLIRGRGEGTGRMLEERNFGRAFGQHPQEWRIAPIGLSVSVSNLNRRPPGEIQSGHAEGNST